jgi:hypothetical protein
MEFFIRFLRDEFREHRVEDDLQSVVDQVWDDPREMDRACFEARIRVDFDEPNIQVFVDHEVVAVDLEAVKPSIWVDFLEYRDD